MITESEIINKYFKKLTLNSPSSLNLTDDVFFDNKKKIVVSTDTYIEGVHFFNSKKPSNFLFKTLRASISDIICKGVQPNFYFLNLNLKKINHSWLNDFYRILKSEQKKYKINLGGGDIVKSNKFSISFTIIGYPLKKKVILRSGAKVGDDIYVTGNIGSAYYGYLHLKNKISTKNKKFAIKEYLKPNLPYRFSKFLPLFASSAVDVSDGIYIDLKHICEASNKSARLNFSKIPFTKNLSLFNGHEKYNKRKDFMFGDDYQILFTAHKSNRNKISNYAKRSKTKVTLIGDVVSNRGKNVILIDNNNKEHVINANKMGYLHNF